MSYRSQQMENRSGDQQQQAHTASRESTSARFLSKANEPLSALKALAVHPVTVTSNGQTAAVSIPNRPCIPHSMPKHAGDVLIAS